MGLIFVWPAVFLSLFGAVKSKDAKVLAISSVLFVLVNAYVGPRDCCHGRFFLADAVLSAPLAGLVFGRVSKLLRVYVVIGVLLGSISALFAVTNRENQLIFAKNDRSVRDASIFERDRTDLLTRNDTRMMEPIQAFERLVPKDATVATCFGFGEYEYPLFGPKLSRRIIPINSFYRGLQPVPKDAQYLVYSKDCPIFSNGDMPLGQGWRLRHIDNP